MRDSNDLGDLPAGPVDTAPHDPTFWEKQIDAMNMLLAQKGLRRTDENRRPIGKLHIHDLRVPRGASQQVAAKQGALTERSQQPGMAKHAHLLLPGADK